MAINRLADLKPDNLNPRRISVKQRDALIRSYVDFGDLSGIVVNTRNGMIIGGHQRTDVFKNRNTTIIKKPHADATGTTALGYAIVPMASGGTMRIPYREVEWDRKKALAANVAANAGGGEFDDVKLGQVMTMLQQGKFPIETIPIDALDIRKAVRLFESENKRALGMDGDGGEFASVSIAEIKEASPHQCPKCGHSWTGTTKPSYGELHRLKDDNPIKIQAKKIAKKILAERAAKGSSEKAQPREERRVRRERP